MVRARRSSRLTAFAGLAIEYNRWQQIATRAQKAADAAALGGAVFMPENVGNKAFTTAQTISSQNGFTNGSNGVTVTTTAGKLPNQLKVTVVDQHEEPVGSYRQLQEHHHRAQRGGRVPVAPEPREPAELVRQRSRIGRGPAPALGQRVRTVVEQGQGRRDPGRRPSRGRLVVQRRQLPELGEQGLRRRPATSTASTCRPGRPARSTCRCTTPAFVHVGDNCGASDANAQNSLNNAATLTAAQIPGYSGTIDTSRAVRISGLECVLQR